LNLKGNPVSPGIAIGSLYIYKPFNPDVRECFSQPGMVEKNLKCFKGLKQAAENEMLDICVQLNDHPDKALIFNAHIKILHDPAINEEIEEGIAEENWRLDWAIEKVYSKYIRLLKKARDLIIRERADDLTDVKKRLLRILYKVDTCDLSVLSAPVIVAAHDLLPSDTATMDLEHVLAILTEVGGATSHSAIIARSGGIPAIVGITELLSQITPEQFAAVDATTGEIIINPDAEDVKRFEQAKEAFSRDFADTISYLSAPPITADGVHIDIGLNIASASEDEFRNEAYTDFVGLFRTEFLFMGKSQLPGEEEQFEAYKKVLISYAPRPVTLRTLDIGGDKTLACMELPKEENPFLGNRALRLCFSKPEIFRTQLRAAFRASIYGNLWLMLPMVGSMDDIRHAKEIIESVKAELTSQSLSYALNIKIGIMIEIPSIAVIADMTAAEVDFASIGTNDLCQYLTAVDRMNASIASYYQNFHPAMFRLMGYVIRTFNEQGKPISVCGEMGGDPLAAAVLIGLGMRKLSMGSASIAPVKRMLSRLTISKAVEAAERVQRLASSDDVKKYLKDFLI
jgi:phosphotransferase system enzyme I (PtsI)